MKLNLGSGYDTLEGWEHVDILDYGSNVVADVLNILPYENDTFDFVLLNHTLQVFDYNEHQAVFEEIKRVMKDDATIRIIVPDFDKAIKAYNNGDQSYFPINNNIEKTLAGKFARYVFWHGETKSAFNYWSLTDLLKRNGFRAINVGTFGECELDIREEDSTREYESIVVEARK